MRHLLRHLLPAGEAGGGSVKFAKRDRSHAQFMFVGIPTNMSEHGEDPQLDGGGKAHPLDDSTQISAAVKALGLLDFRRFRVP